MKVSPLYRMFGDLKQLLKDKGEDVADKIRSNADTGRVSGSDSFLESLDLPLMRTMKQRKAGRKMKGDN